MRRAISIVGTLLVGGWALFVSHQVWAFPALARQTKAACAACHTNPAGGPALTEAGKAIQADPKAAVSTETKGVDYVGSAKCKMCHMKQHQAWGATDHAHAWATLAKADEKTVAAMAESLKIKVTGTPATTEACIGCHVTGFQLSGGYPAADSTKNVALQNVTCESCHGPGSKHLSAPMAEKKTTISRTVTAKMCTQCHTAAVSPKFNFEEYKKRGVHVVAAATTTTKPSK